MKIPRLRILILGLLATSLALAAAAGCSKSNVVSVSGKALRKDGTPVRGAQVIARSDESGKTVNGQTDANGHYDLGTEKAGDGVPPGNYYVVVIEDLGDEHARRPATIANKYSKPSTSGLKFTVQAAEKTVFDMSLDPK